jgi:E3 ubiquitin-protein ligase RNF213
MVESDIINFFEPIINEALVSPSTTFVVFFDEINTFNSQGLMKEIICDRYLNGEIPKNIKLIAALNPYREREVNKKKIGIKSKEIIDDLDILVYRVYPIPDSFVDFIFDFGSLNPEIEKIYARSMMRSKLNIGNNGKLDVGTEIIFELFLVLVCESQNFIRKTTNEVSSCSLRDIERFLILFIWFDNNTNKNQKILKNGDFNLSTDDQKTKFNNILIITLGHVYYSRLTRANREKYRLIIEYYWKLHCKTNPLLKMFNFKSEKFIKVIESIHQSFAKNMNPGKGIALNEALTENIFMLVISILNKIPIFVIGLPVYFILKKKGSSKSLAMDLLSQNMKGKSSINEHNKSFPSIDIFTHQCSPLTKSEDISSTFTTANKYSIDAKDRIVVVLLDEIGLAEQSIYRPLKVLHKEFEQTTCAVVGISNFFLDVN